MTNETRNRLIGLAIFLPGLAWVFISPDFAQGVDQLVSFLAGALLGSGAALLITGKALWDPRNTWTRKHP